MLHDLPDDIDDGEALNCSSELKFGHKRKNEDCDNELEYQDQDQLITITVQTLPFYYVIELSFFTPFEYFLDRVASSYGSSERDRLAYLVRQFMLQSI